MIIWAVFVLSACGSQPHQDDIFPLADLPPREAATVERSEQSSIEIVDSETHQQSSSDIDGSILMLAKNDLAERLGLSTEVIKLLSFTVVDWNDGSLGCPKDGFVYVQSITPGYLIILEYHNQQYEYHT
ncbi:hypothetical protein QUF58_12700, partial [Anaerolineales bacterium HSG24]|nr:hypothetical protein [Anaerolineales bacterium HSG24]